MGQFGQRKRPCEQSYLNDAELNNVESTMSVSKLQQIHGGAIAAPLIPTLSRRQGQDWVDFVGLRAHEVNGAVETGINEAEENYN